MRTKVISASGISEAAEQILAELKEDAAGTATRSSRPNNVIYFDGWNGLGASALLRKVGRMLTPAASPQPPPPPTWGRAPPPLPPPPPPPAAGSLEFSQIFRIDCSKWESRRAMQRAIVEQLHVPAPVIQMLDAQDEEDDYKGVDRESRAEIPQVAEAIYQHIQKLTMNRRFLVIFHNGGSEEIDLDSFGFPLSGYSGSKVLWSFQGRFRLYPRTKVDRALESTRTRTDVLVSATWPSDNWSGSNTLLSAEAEDVLGPPPRWMVSSRNYLDWWGACRQVAQCFQYIMKLSHMSSHLVDYDLITHGCNCWKCDRIIIQLQKHEDAGTDDDDEDNDDDGSGVAAAPDDDDTVLEDDADNDDDSFNRLWLSCDALHREIRLDVDYYQNPCLPSVDPEVLGLSRIPYWTSPTCGFMLIPDLFGEIPKGMFQQFDKLCVLKLSSCTFSFTSPPFLCCHNLRFLWLDHCKHQDASRGYYEPLMTRTEDREGNDDDIRRCFKRLTVLDVRYSSSRFLSAKMMDFMTQLRELNVMGQEFLDMDDVLQGRLNNVRKLRITKCMPVYSHVLAMEEGKMELKGKDKMEHLDFSGNSAAISRLSVDSSCSSLETVIIDGSISLQSISFKGCAKLKNLLLSGLFPELYSLDITGTAVKTLDLGAVEAPKLDELILLGCGKLYAILWPPEDKRKRHLGKLRMDTTQNECSNTITGTAAIKGGSPVEFDWYISVRDARILGSLAPVKDYFSPNDAHVVISTTPSPPADAAGGNKGTTSRSRQGNLQQHKDNSTYADVTTTFKDTSMHQQATGGDDYDAWATCPPPPTPRPPHPTSSQWSNTHPVPSFPKRNMPSHDCYMHIEDEMMGTKLQTASAITIPGFICDGVKTLHVHDSLSISSISATPLGSRWNKLEWCRVERCPKLECVFSDKLDEGDSSDADAYDNLRTIWVSHLPNIRYVLEGSGSRLMQRAFKDLTMLHLYCCPRLAYVFSLPNLERLETLEVMWCGDLTAVFDIDMNLSQLPSRPKVLFPNLKHIHLHELPKLHFIFDFVRMRNLRISNSFRIWTPSLETLKIRGCWSLRRLPIVEANNTVECDCEQEWWDRLQWDSRVKPGDYKPTHSRYYKKRMLRGSVLR